MYKTHSFFLSLFLSLSLSHTHTHTLSLSRSHTHTHTLSLSLSHTRTRTRTRTHTRARARTHTHTHYVYIRENSAVVYSLIPCWNESQRWITGYNKRLHYIVVVVLHALPQYVYIVLSGILLDVFIQMSHSNGDFKKELLSHVGQGIPLQGPICPHSSEDFSSWKVTLISE